MNKTFTTKEAIEYLERKEQRLCIRTLCSTDPEEKIDCKKKELKAHDLRTKIQTIFGARVHKATLNY